MDELLAFGARLAVGVAMIPLPMQYATTSDGVRIAYVSLGDGPPLVFASNIFGELNRLSHRMAAHAGRHGPVGWSRMAGHPLDVRGMGSSDRDVEDLSLEGESEIFGGRWTARSGSICAGWCRHRGRHGGRLHRPASGDGHSSGAPESLGVGYAVSRDTAASRRLFRRDGAQGATRSCSRISSEASPRPLRTPISSAPHRSPLHGTSPEGLAAFNGANERIDITSLLPQVRVPTLVTHEPTFPFGSFELCQEVAAGIPNAEFLVLTENSIAGRVHDESVATIDRFLRGGTAMEFIPSRV